LKLDRRLADAIETLRPHPAFQHLLNAIREDVTDQYRVTSAAEGTPLFRAQGKIQALNGLLEQIDQARALLDKPNFK
jgi:hypothetical protein